MIIRLSAEQEKRLLAWAGKTTAAHHADGSMAPGYELIISVSPFGNEAEAFDGSSRLPLGDVDVICDQF